MKKLILLMLLNMFIVIQVFSQERIITDNELSAKINKSTQSLKGRIYRLRTTIITEVDGIQQSQNRILVREFNPPDRRRYVSELIMPNTKRVVETIIIGDKKYVRNDSESWVVSNVASKIPKEKIPSKNVRKVQIISTEVKYVGKDVLNGKSLDVYEQLTKTKLTSEKSKSFTDLEQKSKYWFDAAGFVIKYTNEELNLSAPMKLITRQTWIYEYDDGIKIEAPKMP